MMIGISRDTPWETHEIVSDEDGRFLVLKGRLYQTELWLVGIYAPPSSQQLYWHKVCSLTKTEGEIIYLGDFNAVFDPSLDRSGSTSTPNLSQQFKTNMKEFGQGEKYMDPKETIPISQPNNRPSPG